VRGAIVLADVRLDLDDPPDAEAGCVLPDETGAEQRASGVERGLREERAIELACGDPVLPGPVVSCRGP
jgi:hypothetical protein